MCPCEEAHPASVKLHCHGYLLPEPLPLHFDAVLRDPRHPTQLLRSYVSGDHLHPNNAGCRAEGNAIPLALFEGH